MMAMQALQRRACSAVDRVVANAADGADEDLTRLLSSYPILR